jgi:hypothetical protein
MAAPVPRPPQPTKATLIVSLAPEKKLALVSKGLAINPPATSEADFTKSLLEGWLEASFMLCVFIFLDN